MEGPPGNSTSNYHQLFSWIPSHIGNTKVLIYISSIWIDDHIERPKNNQWKFLWYKDVTLPSINGSSTDSRSNLRNISEIVSPLH